MITIQQLLFVLAIEKGAPPPALGIAHSPTGHVQDGPAGGLTLDGCSAVWERFYFFLSVEFSSGQIISWLHPLQLIFS